MAQSKYKPLSFSTTMRNPERIATFLKCITKYEGEILTNELIDKIVVDIIKAKLYRPNYIGTVPSLKAIYEDESNTFSDHLANDIIANSPQKHKEAGFDYGWPSRFDTWYKLPMEFGFIKYSIGEPIQISETGHMLVDAVSGETVDDEKIQNIFLNAMTKYQTDNPFRKISNSNNPLLLFLNVIKLLKENDPDSAGISRQELSFLICWPNANYQSLYQKIITFRNLYGVASYSDEIIYNECLSILGYGEEGKKYIKKDKVTGEAVDEYIRKMRITGVVSLRGNGRFLDWNTLKQDKIDYILSNYSAESKEFTDINSYLDYIGTIDPEIIKSQSQENVAEITDIRQKTLERFANDYDVEYIRDELRITCSRRSESKDDLLKFIPAPARLEFLVSILIKQSFRDIIVKPNYPIDDEGIPTSTASGGMGDIECEDEKKELIEVTLIQGRNQVTTEMLPISRHLDELGRTTEKECAAVFLAPTIHPDAARYTKWILDTENLKIISLDIEKFIYEASNNSTLSELVSTQLNCVA